MHYIIKQTPDCIYLYYISKSKAKVEKMYTKLVAEEENAEEGILFYKGYFKKMED